MFTKILIANRGEIACRVMRTAREMGVKCVAVYSDADAGALHVAMADEAVHIGGPAVADSYLKGDAIIAAALKTGAQAIHPGYGFLSENAEFVDDVSAAGLVFIGPSATSIRAMGLKDAAKKLMVEAGVPVVPGYHGANQDAEFLAAEAAKIGYPVLVKAVAGGGGKGMRLVAGAADFGAALASARSEALASFGNDAVLVEKLIEKPRHIEIQVFGDGSNVVHLFERDCSVQRRHQKVIEEAPAPGMTDEMRTAMCDAAIKAAQATNYTNAGTVEFIVDVSDGLRPDCFWFMEMNTRLQVEHPVTEAVTGVDLVSWQLRVAVGEPLPKRQNQLALNGHAFEARLYAEDAENGFLPATGTLNHLHFPDRVRVDSGVRPGDEISPYYDPMIAKMTAHGPTREIALMQLSAALMATELAGTTTNLSFLRILALQPDFMRGDVDTGLIARHFDALTKAMPPDIPAKALAAIYAAKITGKNAELHGFCLWAPLRRAINLSYRGEIIAAILTMRGGGDAAITVGEQDIELRLTDGEWVVRDCLHKIRAKRFSDRISVFGHSTWEFEVPDPLRIDASNAPTGNVIAAPMPGLIKAVFAVSGQKVAAGDRLVILGSHENGTRAVRPARLPDRRSDGRPKRPSHFRCTSDHAGRGRAVIRLHHCHQTRSMRVLWLLRELGVDFEIVLHNFDKSLRSEDYLNLSPAGRVPSLEMDDDIIWESGAIIQVLWRTVCIPGAGPRSG